MSMNTGRIARAVRVAPRSVRERYDEEWRRDLRDAEAHGRSRREVERAAFRLAVDLRARHIGRRLLGAMGLGNAVGAWCLLAVGLFVVGLLPFGTALVAAGILVVAVVLARAGAPSHWSHWLMVASLLLGASSATFVWWAAGAKFSASESMTPEPEAARWAGAAVLTLVVSPMILLLSAIVSERRERKLSS